MKILLVNYEYKGQGGGAGQHTYYMARAFRDMGHEVSLLIGWDSNFGSPVIFEDVSTYIIKYRKKNIQLSTPIGLLMFVLKGIFSIRRLTSRFVFDIIMFYFSVPTGILKFGICGRIPYVISLRGMDIPGLQKDRNSILRVLTSLLNRHVTAKAKIVTSLSNEAALAYERFSTTIAPVVIPNAVDCGSYNVKKAYSDKIRRFVTISRLVSFKRLDLLIDAIILLKRAYPEISLDIYGDGYLSTELQKHIEDNNANDYVNLKGYVDKMILCGTLCEYDVFILLSNADSFGQVFIEAMSCGLPVVAANAGGPKDIVINDVTGLLVKQDCLDDTIMKVKYCIENPEKMASFGINGRKRVEETYCIKDIAQKHIELFHYAIINNKEKN